MLKNLGFNCLPVPDDDSKIFALYDSTGKIWASNITAEHASTLAEAMNQYAVQKPLTSEDAL